MNPQGADVGVLRKVQVWLVTGSQALYGEEALAQVAEHAETIARALSLSDDLAVDVVPKPVASSPQAIASVCQEANRTRDCIGIIAWMHTFSPAKMWIGGLGALQKPLLHLHTQFNRDIPWDAIDMDFMNLNQSAHGGREFGFICSRMRLARKVVVGHWKDPDVRVAIDTWARAASAWHDLRGARIVRFGDNMREVAVTEGDKVEAQIRLGYDVVGYGIGDLVHRVKAIGEAEIDSLVAEYGEQYVLGDSIEADEAQRRSLREAARIELGMRSFLEDGEFKAFTTTFEDLHGLTQLPGLAVQRLMAHGYGFGAEGDWKTAALVRAMKVMSFGREGGTSFMEDYTYHLEPGRERVLGAHMLEICPSIAEGQPTLEVHPLSIGGKADPSRLVFDVASGPAVNASIIDLGSRLRMIVNAVDVVAPDAPLPNLPVARVVWVPRPNLKDAAKAWILAGGAHHTGFSQALTKEHLQDFADIADMEIIVIDEATDVLDLTKELRWNEVYYRAAGGFR